MENQNHLIDEIFRQRLHDSEVPPPPFVWPAVEQGLQKRKRRLAFLWFGSIGVVAATAILLWQSNLWNTGNLTQVSSSKQETPAMEQTNDPQAESLATTDQAAKSGSVIETSSGTDAQELNSAEGTAAPKAKNSAQHQRTASKGNGAKFQASQNELSTKEGTAIKPVAYQSTETPETIAAQKLIFNPYEVLALNDLALVTSNAASEAGFSPKTYKSHSRKKKAQPKVCYDFARHPNAWLVDVYAGPSLAQRSLTSRVDDTPYLNQRLATERRSLAYNAGIRASLMFNSNFLVRTGLNYEQVTEVFEFIDPTSVTYILKFTPGDPIPDTLGVQYGENYLKTYNRYGMLDVPLLVGVEMRRGRTGFSINAGFTANILFKKNGVIIDPNTHEPARFGQIPDNPNAIGPKNSVSEEVFRSTLGLSANASIQWYWHLGPKFRVFAEPSFRQVLRPVTLGSHPVEQRYSIMGLRVGATRIF